MRTWRAVACLVNGGYGGTYHQIGVATRSDMYRCAIPLGVVTTNNQQ